jgi:hypothetical protein
VECHRRQHPVGDRIRDDILSVQSDHLSDRMLFIEQLHAGKPARVRLRLGRLRLQRELLRRSLERLLRRRRLRVRPDYVFVARMELRSDEQRLR